MFKFGKKRKEAEKKIRDENCSAEEKRLEKAIAEAAKIEDPAERLLKLEEIKNDINDVLRKENSRIGKKATKSYNRTTASGVGTSCALMLGSLPTLVVAPPVALGMLAAGAPGMVASLFAGEKREEVVRKKLKKEIAGHLQTMDDLMQTVTDMKETTIETQKDAIVLSPFFEQVLKNRSLSGLFLEAAAQKISQLKEEAEAAPKIETPAADKPAIKREPTPHVFSKKPPILK